MKEKMKLGFKDKTLSLIAWLHVGLGAIAIASFVANLFLSRFEFYQLAVLLLAFNGFQMLQVIDRQQTKIQRLEVDKLTNGRRDVE